MFDFIIYVLPQKKQFYFNFISSKLKSHKTDIKKDLSYLPHIPYIPMDRSKTQFWKEATYNY